MVALQNSDSVVSVINIYIYVCVCVYIYCFSDSFPLCYCKILNIVPCTMQ